MSGINPTPNPTAKSPSSVPSRRPYVLCAVFAMAEGPLIFTVPKVRVADTVESVFASRLLQTLTVLTWSEHDDVRLICH